MGWDRRGGSGGAAFQARPGGSGRDLTRRALLGATGAALLGAAGCRRPGARAASAPSAPRAAPASASAAAWTLVVNANDLAQFSDVFQKAWAATAPAFEVSFIDPGPAGLSTLQDGGIPATGGGDLLEVVDARMPLGKDLPLLPLRAYLQAGNLDMTQLLPGSLTPFTDSTGTLVGLPVVLSEIQFYVNTALLQASGFKEPGRWTWDDLLAAAGALPAATPPLVTGQGWATAPNIWGAMVIGLGGTLLGAHGQIDLSGAAGAAQQMLDGCRTLGWDPGGTAGNLYADGFSGTEAGALFDFDQPWSAFSTGGPRCAMCQLSPRAFPSFGSRDIAPAWPPIGLGISAASKHPDQAAAFLQWLLQPAQQRLLVSSAVAPVLQAPDVVSFWNTALAGNPRWPRFDPAAYFDLTTYLPPILPPLDVSLASYLTGIANHLGTQLWNGSADVPTALAGAQATLGAAEAAYQAAAAARSTTAAST